MAIHGNKSQSARTKALADFKSGDLRVLVATDIAARGIDIDQLPHVVNYELPNVPEDYVHRIGRTGRAGASGEAISLVCVDEEIFLRDIERLIKREIPREVVKGFEPDPSERAEPIVLGRMTIGVGGNRRGGNGGRPSRPPQGRAQQAGAPVARRQPAARHACAARRARAAGPEAFARPAARRRPRRRPARWPWRRTAAPWRPRPLTPQSACKRTRAPDAAPLLFWVARSRFSLCRAWRSASLADCSSFLPSKPRLFMSATHSSSTGADSLMNSCALRRA